MVAVAGSITASWLAVWTATMTQCEVESYCVLPASPPSSMGVTTRFVRASIAKSRCPDSSETKTRRSSGAYAIPSGNDGPGIRATILNVEDDQLPRPHVGDEESPGVRLEALIIEAGSGPREWMIGDQLERCSCRRCAWDCASPARFHRRPGQRAGRRRLLRADEGERGEPEGKHSRPLS